MINSLKKVASLYHPKLPFVIIYMLQQVEYNSFKFCAWVIRFPDYARVVHRQTLVLTIKAKMLLFVSYASWLVGIVIFIILLTDRNYLLAALLFVLLPTIPIGSTITATLFGTLLNKFGSKKLISQSKEIFKQTKAVKIAVIGSYGKTTIKELLTTVLSEGKNAASTPGNMNVSASHAKFAKTLTGEEEVLIIEFGEGRPGDVARMSGAVSPDYAVVTGLAPNHLDFYPSLEAVAKDLLSVYDFVKPENVFVTGESPMLRSYITDNMQTFDSRQVMGWQISGVEVSFDGIVFVMSKDSKKLSIHSGLLGCHQVAPIAFAAAIADKLGLSAENIESGCAKTLPFVHRMQPRNIHGAWLIDDTYNGNLEGVQAGLKLLSDLEGRRKWYVTPGLVDQGSETERVHLEMGKSIAKANPDIVVLMENSVRHIIENAMSANGFSGELRVESNPLEFYTNIEHVVAAGDIVLMQNDWTDNYS